MNKYFFLSVILLIFSGCSGSLIRLKTTTDLYTYPMFGRTPEKNFVFPETIGDTLIKKWENDINGGLPFSSITFYGGYIFLPDLSGRIYCFNDSTGKQAGKLKYKGAIFSAPVIEQTNIIFPVVLENNNISNLISYNFVAGKENYSKEIKGKILSEVLKSGNNLIFITEEGVLFNYSIDGEEKWKIDLNKPVHSNPALSNGIIFLGDDEGEIIAVNFESGKLLFRKKIAGPFFASPSIRDGIAFIGNDDGKLYAININSGNIEWEFSTTGRITMTSAVTERSVIFGNLNGDLYNIKRSDGKQIWKISTGGLLNSTPLVAKNKLIVPDYNRKFYSVDPESGKILNTYNLDGRLKLSPVITDSTLFIGYENGNICAYKI